MPRIKTIRVRALPYQTGQDPARMGDLELTGRNAPSPDADFLLAVERDYVDGITDGNEPQSSDIYAAWNQGFGVEAAGFLMGATECVHVAAVQWAYGFNGWLTDETNIVDPYSSERWQEFHDDAAIDCPSCEAANYFPDEIPDDPTCDNCSASLGDKVDPEDLNDRMAFEHVIEVRKGGLVIDRDDLYAPETYWSDGPGADIEFCGYKGWTALDGYSGQDRYSGPVMHESEYVGGRMARDILDTPGVYVCVVIDDLDDEENPAGWAVVRYDESTEEVQA